MLLDKANLAVRHASSVDETRLNLQGVYIAADGATVATDGYILARVAAPDADETEFPNASAPAETLKPCIISAASAAAIEKAIPKATRSLPILAHAHFDNAQANANGHLAVVTTDLDTTNTLQAPKVGAEFPDYAQSIPKGDAAFRVTFNAKLLARLVKVAQACSESELVTMEFFGDLGDRTPEGGYAAPIRITNGSARFLGLLMPARG